jgi:type II secretory pathway pseudopilin PulG
MDNIPYTTDYLILGLIVVFVIFGLFIASMVIRYRSLTHDARMIEQLGDDNR